MVKDTGVPAIIDQGTDLGGLCVAAASILGTIVAIINHLVHNQARASCIPCNIIQACTNKPTVESFMKNYTENQNVHLSLIHTSRHAGTVSFLAAAGVMSSFASAEEDHSGLIKSFWIATAAKHMLAPPWVASSKVAPSAVLRVVSRSEVRRTTATAGCCCCCLHCKSS